MLEQIKSLPLEETNNNNNVELVDSTATETAVAAMATPQQKTNGFNNIHLSTTTTTDKLLPFHHNHQLQPLEKSITNTTTDVNDNIVDANATTDVDDDDDDLTKLVKLNQIMVDQLYVEQQTLLSLRTAAATPTVAEQCGYPKRVRSLVDDAKFDTLRNIEFQRAVSNASRTAGSSSSTADVSEEESPETLSPISCSPVEGEIDEVNDVRITTTTTTKKTNGDICSSTASSTELMIDALTVNLNALKSPEQQCRDFPTHISQLDQCNHLLIKYEPELDPTHPGFHDLEYRERRKQVAQIAFDYRYGQRIPEVEYNEKEIGTWKYIYIRLKEAYKLYACEQHNKAIEQLEKEAGYSPDSIPQLQVVSEFLERKTGWRLRPAAGLLSARDFLASLAFRVFQTTQYIRHWGNPEHSVEPDCIHELMGHIPMLCDPSFAQFSQEVGLASLGATDEQIERFATLYWFTVEFGLCREAGQLKCYGAGLLSSYGEMEHALESGKPALRDFVPEETAVEQYDDAEYQVVYYVAESFDDAKAKIKQYAAKHLKRDFEITYDPYTLSIKLSDTYPKVANGATAAAAATPSLVC